MKNKKLLLIILTLSLLLTACSGNAPAKAAEAWMQAIATSDGVAALALTCDAYKPAVQEMGFLMGGINMLTEGMLSDIEVDTSGLEFETISKSGNQAVVSVSGSIIQGMMGMAMEQPINATVNMLKEDGDWKYCGDR